MPAPFDDIHIGQVVSLGVAAVDPKALDAFIAAFAPGWDAGARRAGRLGLRDLGPARRRGRRPTGRRPSAWASTPCAGLRNPPAGELLRGRMTVMGKDPVGEGKGIVIAQHDLLDEAGRLVFSCLTRSRVRALAPKQRGRPFGRPSQDRR